MSLLIEAEHFLIMAAACRMRQGTRKQRMSLRCSMGMRRVHRLQQLGVSEHL